MKKIPTLFERQFTDHMVVKILPKVAEGMEWVLAGEGMATVKWDGSCCAVINGEFYRRYDAKHGKKIPASNGSKRRLRQNLILDLPILLKSTISNDIIHFEW